MSTIEGECHRRGKGSLVNAITVDVEDYFQVSVFEANVDRQNWDHMPSRIQRNVGQILELFERHEVKATFFVLGWVAERFPRLIKQISAAGHEIASHGRQHVRVFNQSPEQFRDDVTHTRKLLEDTCGQPISGYRAASFSIGSGNLWALDVLQEVGYCYSSSIYPVHHDLYGMPEAPRFPFRLRENALLEIPITTVSLLGRKFPCGGGGYFRLLPYALSRWALRRVNQHDQQPAVFYFHPWELDPEQPRVDGISRKSRFRHYLNLGRTEARLQRLLTDFCWGRMDHIFLAAEREEPACGIAQ